MRVFEKTASFKKNPRRPLVLALGNFDGIHRGHQSLLKYVVAQARELGGQAAVFTFQQHPQHVLHPAHASENLQSRNQKIVFLKSIGVQVCFFQKFDKNFSKLSAESFVKTVLIKRLGVREICIGYNARFGRGRAGDADLLKRMGEKLNFKVFQADPVIWKGSPVSSTAVREALRQGEVKTAAELLGRNWSFEGKVVRGDGRGKKLGFPTANFEPGDFVCPARGVYAVYGRIVRQKKTWPGVVNIGVRPSFKKNDTARIEAHFFNMRKNLYGKEMEIFFIKHLRPEKKFASAEQLKRQINQDIQTARRVLKEGFRG